jgi:hypothetical protein
MTFHSDLEMRVHTASGRVDFEAGHIEPAFDKNAFLNSSLGRAAEVVVENMHYVSYRILPESGVAAIVYFEGAKLRSVSWQLSLSSEAEREWTEESELERKRLHDLWLRENCGSPPYHYSWGSLDSVYDPKGCVSDIILSYER